MDPSKNKKPEEKPKNTKPPSNNKPKNNNTATPQNKGTLEMNSGENAKKQLASPFNFLPSLFHTFAKLLPIGLYVSTLLESILFNDIRGFLIFLGLVINDLINIGYNYMLEKKPKEKCALVRNIYTALILTTIDS